MVNPESGRRLNAMIDDAVAKGAKLVAGGKANGAVMQPTILDHVTANMQIFDDETFGPITTVVRASSTEDAVRLANATEYGLSAGVFGRDTHRALSAALQIDCGSVHVNGSTVQNEAQAPYGGMKASGYGRFDGRAVIDEFTELKWITIEPLKQDYPF
jgi:acyl-CoA reductase-like NAD-dependent aldehyde dehydrogenase